MNFSMQCPVPFSQYSTVQLAHGGGGRLMRELIEGLFRAAFAGSAHQQPKGATIGKAAVDFSRTPLLAAAHDSAVLEPGAGPLAFTTDSFVVSPLFFPGGDIGRLAVFGTVNDLAMAGATPLALSAAFIIEEGFPFEQLQRVVESMAQAAVDAGVRIVTGDTKVVDRGKGDGVFITTSGVGRVPPSVAIHPSRVAAGDQVLISGDVGRHGLAIMSVRQGLEFETELQSDCAPLNGLVEAMLAAAADPRNIHCLRDLTRGGLAAAANEIAQDAGVGIVLHETEIPVCTAVRAACELLGLDPLYAANEGRLMAIVAARSAPAVLAAMKSHPAGADARLIGTVSAEHAGMVELLGPYGPGRILDLLSGEQMPRIC